MTLSVNVSGTYHNAQPSVHVSGAWHSAIWWTRVSGVWKEISLGPFTATCPDSIGNNGSSITFDVPMTASVTSGGPVSGNMSYAWTVTLFSPVGGFSSTLLNATSQTCTVHFNFGTTPGHGQQVFANLQCVVTDNVSGLQSTLTCEAGYTFN